MHYVSRVLQSSRCALLSGTNKVLSWSIASQQSAVAIQFKPSYSLFPLLAQEAAVLHAHSRRLELLAAAMHVRRLEAAALAHWRVMHLQRRMQLVWMEVRGQWSAMQWWHSWMQTLCVLVLFPVQASWRM